MAGKAITIGEAVVEILLDTKGMEKDARRAQRSLNNISKTAGTLNNIIKTGLIVGIGALTASFAKLTSEVVKTGAAFEQAVTTVGAIMGATDNSEASVSAMKAIENQARLLGSATAFTATEAANAMQDLARAGLDASEIVGASTPALQLAGASASNMGSATSIMAAAMKQFGLEASESTRIADAFTIVQQNTLMDMEHLTSAMRYGGTIAHSFGMNIEEASAALGLFRDLGVEGSTAGTQFRQAMISLAAPAKKAQKTLKAYGADDGGR